MDYKQQLISFELYLRHIVKSELKEVEKPPELFNYRDSTQFFPDDEDQNRGLIKNSVESNIDDLCDKILNKVILENLLTEFKYFVLKIYFHESTNGNKKDFE